MNIILKDLSIISHTNSLRYDKLFRYIDVTELNYILNPKT